MASAAQRAAAAAATQPANVPANAPAPQKKAVQKISDELAVLRPELQKVLPAHVPVEKFIRVVETALVQSPDLRNADRRSLLTSCIKCATDGLLPDGREAALVIFNTKQKVIENERQVERWIKQVQYMPMVRGILKLMRNSGELMSIGANVVYEKDEFRYWIDDEGEHLTHEPNVVDDQRGKMLAVYAVGKTKDGGVYVEVMSRSDVEKVRAISKSKDRGPWVDWYEEMAKKTVIRRLSKRMPLSTDLERVIERDNAFYNVTQLRQEATSGAQAAKAVLGLPAPTTQAEVENESQALPVDDTPIFHTDSAIQAIKESGSVEDLQKAWDDIVADYDATGREIPPEVDEAYKKQRDTLAKT